jgi:hypothetical protein
MLVAAAPQLPFSVTLDADATHWLRCLTTYDMFNIAPARSEPLIRQYSLSHTE